MNTLVCSRCNRSFEIPTGGRRYAMLWKVGFYLCGRCFILRTDENLPRIILA